eukprot:3135935-Rhodomonas_salina.1
MVEECGEEQRWRCKRAVLGGSAGAVGAASCSRSKLRAQSSELSAQSSELTSQLQRPHLSSSSPSS